ncbi:MAG: MerR family transcriptional regulator [Pseudonocardiaceae bacterium]
MNRLTIGEFARASRLTQKALRLYDELGLLPPAHVDPRSGYRTYDLAQPERAQLVVWLRGLGMPLARIRLVCDLPPRAATVEVASYWGQVEADTAARKELATFLIDHLSRKDTDMADVHPGLDISFAARTDRGLVRWTIAAGTCCTVSARPWTARRSRYASSSPPTRPGKTPVRR